MFGTEDCGGQVAEQAGESYPVLGVIPTLEPTLVRLARPEDGPVLDRCVLVGDTGAEALLRWNLSGQTLDFRLLLDMLWNLALVLPVVYLAVLCWHLMKPWRQLTWPVDRALVVRLLLGLACLAGLVGLMSLVRIPPQMIPTKWSDFEFWGRWWAAEQENLQRIFTTPLGNRQLGLMSLVRIPPQMIPTKWSDFEFWGRWWAAEQENLQRIFTTPLGNRQLQILLDMVKSMGMIPTKWSDFEFWGRWWAAEQENLQRIFTTPLGNRQLQILLDMVKSMGSWGVSLLAGLLALAFRKRREKKEEAPCASC